MDDPTLKIWILQSQQDIDGLAEALTHPNAEMRRRAAVALRVLDARSCVGFLETSLDAEENPRVRMALAAALETLAAPQETTPSTRKPPQTRLERLMAYVVDGPEESAIQAATALGKIGDKSTVPALISTFRNIQRPARVRLATAEALLKMRSAPAEATLLAALRSSKPASRRKAAAILGQLSADWAVWPLGRALYDPNDEVTRMARAALRRIATPEAREILKAVQPSIVDTARLDKSTVSEELRRNGQSSNRQTARAGGTQSLKKP